jgi:tetratricopeptide (TPR) repeat protein
MRTASLLTSSGLLLVVGMNYGLAVDPAPVRAESGTPKTEAKPSPPSAQQGSQVTTAMQSLATYPIRYRTVLVEAMQAFAFRDFVGALKYLDKADTILPPTKDSINIRAAIAIEERRLDEGAVLVDRVLKMDPNYLEALFNRCEIPFLKGDYVAAREGFMGLQHVPGARDLVNYRIYLTFLFEGNKEEAGSWAAKFTLPSNSPAYYFVQFSWEYTHGDPEKAGTWLNSAQEVWPTVNCINFADVLVGKGGLRRDELSGTYKMNPKRVKQADAKQPQ